MNKCKWMKTPQDLWLIPGRSLYLLKDKSPGTDGLSSEFHQSFSQQIAPFLLQVFNESMIAKAMTQGLITQRFAFMLIIGIQFASWTMITKFWPWYLLEDFFIIILYFFIFYIWWNTFFIPKRYIFNNIRLVLDVVDYSFSISDDNFYIYILRLFQAFDTVAHNFLYHSLKVLLWCILFCFFFCDAIKL